MPVTAMVNEMFGAMMAKGQDGWDHSALLTLIENWTQHEIGANFTSEF